MMKKGRTATNRLKPKFPVQTCLRAEMPAAHRGQAMAGTALLMSAAVLAATSERKAASKRTRRGLVDEGGSQRLPASCGDMLPPSSFFASTPPS